jgi:hypothetical protein
MNADNVQERRNRKHWLLVLRRARYYPVSYRELWHRNKYTVTNEKLLLKNTQLTPWSRNLLEKVPAAQPLKKFPGYYANRRFITVFTRTLH